MSKPPARSFSREFKLNAIERMQRGAVISALSIELGVRRQVLYRWREAHRGGKEPRPRGRPPKAEALAREAASVEGSELAAGRRKIADLERKVGQQQLEIDFFRQALRQVEALGRPSDGSGVTASSPKSKR